MISPLSSSPYLSQGLLSPTGVKPAGAAEGLGVSPVRVTEPAGSAFTRTAIGAASEWNGGYQALGKNPFATASSAPGTSPSSATPASDSLAAGAAKRPPGGGTSEQSLSPDAQRQLDKLKETDRLVRAHEQAHIAAGGSLVQGGASFSYQKGPDGRMYAVGGEVSIDTSPGRTPEESLAKARQIRAAALAPADPSPQDRRVAAGAARLEANARAEMQQQENRDSASVATGSGAGGEAAAGVAEAYRSAMGEAAPGTGPVEETSRIDLFA